MLTDILRIPIISRLVGERRLVAFWIVERII